VLDVFSPKGKVSERFPVLLFVHGGTWMFGDKNFFGMYRGVGRNLARHGIVTVLINYRLSPLVKHPEHIKDVARAFAWAYSNIARHGGRPDQLFVVGHSAGGHLAALLVTDELYLHSVGRQAADVKGVVALSGVYRIPDGAMVVNLGGEGPMCFRLDELAPVRGDGNWGWTRWLGIPGLPLRVDVFSPPFGDDVSERRAASPIQHVRPGLPPFLLLYAENDLPSLPGMAEEFHRALLAQGCSAEVFRVLERNHNSIVFRAVDTQDPVARAMLTFVRRLSGPSR
jgi:acetyl esterase/lipase